ncbi:hypothetical protein C6499_22285 [Candidatus Poribacteria bacterium]|nr:MAG: hypothetical protein C6499_22285 [Candidatus Poribacteria bacterium]
MVTRIFQQTFLKINRFAFTLHFVFIASILLAGCTAPAHLMNKSEPTQAEKLQQTTAVWKGEHISKAIQKWGPPHEVEDNGTDWKTYVWQVPVQAFVPHRSTNTVHRRVISRYPNGMRGVEGTSVSTGYALHFTFYTRPNGIIYKTLAKKNYDSGSELKWR